MKAQVVSGKGIGGKYVEVYSAKIEKAFNLKPYPGTLNLKPLSDLPPFEPTEIPGFGKFGSIGIVPCVISNERAFVVIPSKGRQEKGVIEVISEKNIKALLGLKDGDYVDIQF